MKPILSRFSERTFFADRFFPEAGVESKKGTIK